MFLPPHGDIKMTEVYRMLSNPVRDQPVELRHIGCKSVLIRYHGFQPLTDNPVKVSSEWTFPDGRHPMPDEMMSHCPDCGRYIPIHPDFLEAVDGSQVRASVVSNETVDWCQDKWFAKYFRNLLRAIRAIVPASVLARLPTAEAMPTGYSRIPGFAPIGLSPVPGTGAVLSACIFNGVIYAARKNTVGAAVVYKAATDGWQKASASEHKTFFALARVDMKYPTWEQDIRAPDGGLTPEFAAWMKTQAPERKPR